MTCKQLGGACDEVFEAASFEQMAELSKAHATEMFSKNEQAHLDAAQAMQTLMQKEGAMQTWFDAKRAEFDALPEN